MRWGGRTPERREDTLSILALVAVMLLLGLILAAAANAGGCRDRHYSCWKRTFKSFPVEVQQKLKRVAYCESRMNRHAHSPGGTYHSYFQYDLQTAAYAGFRRHVDETSFAQQAVRTWRLVQREGSWGRWPHCGYV